MQKKPVLKLSREFFKNDFFENLLPSRKLNKKQKKYSFRRNVSKSVNQAFDSIKKKSILLQKKQVKIPQKLKIWFSPEQLKNELSKKKQKSSEFKNQLKERKKLSILYGILSKKYIQKIYQKANQKQGQLEINWFQLLESRLDVVLFRTFFFKNIKQARQWVTHKKILVNKQIVDIPSYSLKPGDVISLKSYSKKMLFFLKQKKKTKNRLFSWPFFDFFLIKKWNLDGLNKQLSLRLGRLKSNQKKQEFKLVQKSTRYFILLHELRQTLVFQLLHYIQYSFKKRFLQPKVKLYFFKALKDLENSLNNNILFCIKLSSFKYFYWFKNLKYYTPYIHTIKPSHIEISYKKFTLIFLHYPEKIGFPATLNLNLIAKSFK